ncbi:hypothetical protein CHELA20_11385 [Hyphomicrobiales bacterium]|nr:hypothetical protein CHELA20_11385 [Hyphomicrobiales bacterium]CAH1695757.1 hypothetical protein CHELA41_51632 [Hyphomicrobiales bacterium]
MYYFFVSPRGEDVAVASIIPLYQVPRCNIATLILYVLNNNMQHTSPLRMLCPSNQITGV